MEGVHSDEDIQQFFTRYNRSLSSRSNPMMSSVSKSAPIAILARPTHVLIIIFALASLCCSSLPRISILLIRLIRYRRVKWIMSGRRC